MIKQHYTYIIYLQVQQVLCSSSVLPPTGCLQYHTGITGQVGKRIDICFQSISILRQVRSFNFLVSDSSSYKHLANQYYKICIRREIGYCKIAWTASSDPDSFKIRKSDQCQYKLIAHQLNQPSNDNNVWQLLIQVILTLSLCCLQSS